METERGNQVRIVSKNQIKKPSEALRRNLVEEKSVVNLKRLCRRAGIGGQEDAIAAVVHVLCDEDHPVSIGSRDPRQWRDGFNGARARGCWRWRRRWSRG